MKSLFLKLALVAVAALAYIAAPFVTTWSIREAARSGDSAYLARAIDWPRLRETLKPSLQRIAFDLPDPKNVAHEKVGIWQRFKAYWGQSALESAVDTYLTPETLPKLYAMRKGFREYVSGETDEAKTLPLTERVRRFWARIKRAEFTSLTAFEIDVLDKHDPNRMYLGKLELTATGWMLRELRIEDLASAEKAEPLPLLGASKSAWQSSPETTERKPWLSVGWSLNFIAPAVAAPARR